uniref:Photosystem I assembly protein Ycf4 n=1 Tax=Sesbania drummondii TaxID=206308 RepID=A0A8E7MIL1_9FABA|nr:photosystem I assembly protein Ycf4 [Sesbania drummondii]
MWLWSNVWQSENVRIDYIPGYTKMLDYFFAISTLLSSLAGILVCLSSFFRTNLLSFIWTDLDFEFDPSFLPYNQGGQLLGFYGSSGLFISFYWWIVIFLDVGSGYNLFDKKGGIAFIFRQSFPGDYRRVFHLVPLNDIQCLRIQSITEKTKDGTYLRGGVLYMQTGENGILPLTPDDDYWPPSKVAQTAGELASFLGVPIKIGFPR